MARAPRDYRVEYERRLASAQAVANRLYPGYIVSRRQARGHAGRGEPSMAELKAGRLRAATLAHMGAVNAELRRLGFTGAAVNLANRWGYAVEVSKAGRPFTVGRIPAEIIDRMTHAARQIFFGY